MPISIAALDTAHRRWIMEVPFDEVYTVMEVTRILGQAPTMVYSYIYRGKIQGYKIDGVMHIRHSDLVAFVKRFKTLRRSLNAPIPLRKVAPTQVPSPGSPRTDFTVPLDLIDD